MDRVGIFWDYENCHPPSNLTGYAVVEKLRKAVQALGCVSVFKAYMDVSLENVTKKRLQSELQSSGVSLIHCPHNAQKEVTDKMLLVDLLIFALEGRGPATIVLITGDRDFTYAISVLRMRGHEIIVIFPPGSTHRSIKYLADGMLDWRSDVLECEDPSAKVRTVIANRILQAPRPPMSGRASPLRAEELEPTAGHDLLSNTASMRVVPSVKPETERDRDGSCSSSHSSRRSSMSSFSLLSLAGHEQMSDTSMSSASLPNLISPTARWAEEVSGQWSKPPTWSPVCDEMDMSDDTNFASNAANSPPTSVFDDFANPWILADGEGRCVSEDDEAPVSRASSPSRADFCQVEDSEEFEIVLPRQAQAIHSPYPAIQGSMQNIAIVQQGLAGRDSEILSPSEAKDLASSGNSYSLNLDDHAPPRAPVEQMDIDMPKSKDVLRSPPLNLDRGTGRSGCSSISKQPSGTAVNFLTLIDVLMGERALGRLSTSYGLLGKLLVEANPYVYSQAGVDGLKDYLELAQGENIVFFSGIDWANGLGWISLRSQQRCGLQSVVSTTSSLVDAKFEPLVRMLQAWEAWGGACTRVPFEWLSERVLGAYPGVLANAGALNFRHYIGLAANARVVKVALPGVEWVELISEAERTHVGIPVPPVKSPQKAPTPPVAAPKKATPSVVAPKKAPAPSVAAPKKKAAVSPALAQTSVPSVAQKAGSTTGPTIDTDFTVLVGVLKTMRSQGRSQADRAGLSQALLKQDPLVYRRAGVTKLKSYLKLAEKSRIVKPIDKAADSNIVLHSRFC